MKFFSITSLGALAFVSVLMAACESNDEKSSPQPKTIESTPTQMVEEPAPEEPELISIQSLAAKKDSSTKESPAPTRNIEQKNKGPYVIQVSTQQSKKQANAIVAKLAAQNIKAYVVKVDNPGELEGSFYRIRVGYFTTISDAQEFGKQVLTELNYAWWVDKSKNDNVGKPNSEENE